MRLYDVTQNLLSRPDLWDERRNPSEGTTVLVSCSSLRVDSDFSISVYRTATVEAVQKTGWKVKVLGEDKSVRFGKYGCEIGGRRYMYVFNEGTDPDETILKMRYSQDVPLVIDAKVDKTEAFEVMVRELQDIQRLLDAVHVYPRSAKKSPSEVSAYLRTLANECHERQRIHGIYSELLSLATKTPNNE